jgi:hypothetical protein
LSVPSSITITVGASHVHTTTVNGSHTVYTFTAGDDDITIG